MNDNTFQDFDFSNFWEENDYATKKYVSENFSDDLIKSIEEELGYKLPSAYVELMRIHNGGIPVNTCFPTHTSTSWAENHIEISGVMGIGSEKLYSICGGLGSKFMIEEWEYPDIGIYICNCPSGGHDMVMLDFSKNGKTGEPEVVHVDQENDYRITFLASDFETFIRGLVNKEVYDTSKEDLKHSIEKIANGKFSDVLTELIKYQSDVDYEKGLRNICMKLTVEKKYFALHADDLSYLTYDIQFLLFSQKNEIKSKENYLDAYPSMIALGNGEFSTGGYAPDFVKTWWESRVAKGQIVKTFFSGFKFSKIYKQQLQGEITKYI